MSRTDELQPILDDLAETGVHVDDSAADWLDAGELADLEANVAASPDPLFVVLVDPPDDAPSDPGDDLAFRLHDAGGEDGLYLGMNGIFELEEGPSYSWSAQQWGDVAGETDVTSDVTRYLEYADDGDGFAPGEGLVSLTELLAAGDVDAVATQGSDGLSAAVESNSSGGDGDAGPWLIALLVGAVLAGVAYAGYRFAGRRTAAVVEEERGYALPDSVLDRVREAGDAEAGRRAQAAVLALGEEIDATELDGGVVTSTTTAAWQEALDHYDAASRLLPADAAGGTADVLDVVGALVLAERGSVALEAARRGRRPMPPRPCFLNPLHGDARTAANPIDHEVDGEVRRIDAPLCGTCTDDLEAGRRPDVLDVLDEAGRPVHYFETDREPWASTGFGSLETDLLARLHGTAR